MAALEQRSQAISGIVNVIREIADQVGAISAAAEQQRPTVADAARLLDEIAATAEANRTAMDETIGMVHSLETVARNLSASVEHLHV